MLTPLNVLWPATTTVAGGSSFTMSFILDSKSPMRLLSKKCDDAPQPDVMVSFRGPGVVEPARNVKPMPDGGDSLTYGVGAASDLIGVGGAVNGAGGAATGVDGAVTTGAAGAWTMTVDKDAVGCDCRVGSARVRAVAVTASVGVAAVVVVAAAVAVATLLLPGAAVGVAVKMGVMQAAPTDSFRTARR